MDQSEAVDVVVFGATGDLAARKLIPSLYQLFCTGHLVEGSRVIGAARSDLDDAGFHQFMESDARQYIKETDFEQSTWDAFLAIVCYETVDLMNLNGYDGLANRLNTDPDKVRLYYLSVGPSLFSATCDGLAAAELITKKSRIAVEKPLGRDLESAQEINHKLGTLFTEDQIYRIDHYLGKETVQNLLALRFGNSLFEPLWRHGHIRDVQITVAETLGIGSRGEFYDRTGAMRDMVQNHLLQLLCIIAMECPTGLEPDAMRDEKRKVLRALRPITGADIAEYTVRGQYRDGAINGEAVPAYLDESGVPADSHTETFVSICAHIDTWRWSGVPFYLRTGKRMQEKLTQIVVNFDPLPHNIFADSGSVAVPNKLVIQLQPEESISLQMMAKMPGDRMKLEPVELALNPERNPVRRRHMEAYERVFMDSIKGNQTLFLRRDEVDAAWTWIDPILAGWEASQEAPRPYMSGSWGPAKSSSLLVRDGFAWNEET